MSFSQDKFLGSTSGGDVEELINALAEKVFYRDGSKSMQGPISVNSNNIIGSNVIETNELALGITPAAGKVSIYALTDKKLYIQDDNGTETELAGGGGDVAGPASSTINRLALFSDASGKLLKESNSIIDNAGAMSGITKLNVDDLELNSNLLTTTVGNLELDSFTNLVKIDGNAQIVGDLVVEGTTTTVHSENVYANANYLHNNTDYITTVAETGGLTVRYLPTATNDTQNGAFVAGIASVSNPTVITSGSGTFSSSDIIAIDSSANSSNNGLYEVLTHIGTTLTVRGIGTTGCIENFTNNQFTASATLGSTIRKVNVSIIRADTAGDWETGKGNSTGITYNTMGDIVGPGSSTSDGIALFDGVTGKIIKEASIRIDEADVQDIRMVNTSGSLLAPGVGASLSNCFFGRLAGENTSTLGVNFQNTSVGVDSLTAASGAWGTANNTAIGKSSLAACNGRGNTAIGTFSLKFLDSTSILNGNGNCAMGSQALLNLGTDANLNIAIGANSGTAYISNESNNLLLGSNLSGTVGESDVIRIGNGQSNTFIEGIHGVTPGGATQTVIIDSNGELGSTAAGGSGDVVGPGSSTADAIALFDGVTGKIIKEASIRIDEADVQDIRWVNTSGSLMAPGVGATALSNCFFGRLAGENTSTLSVNHQNTSVGVGSFTSASGAWGTTNNTAVGRSSLAACNGRGNTAIGSLSLYNLNSTSSLNGNENCAMGIQSLINLGTDASLNIAIGAGSGTAYTSNESNNLLIGSNLSGTVGESDVIRIGNGQSNTFIEGIHGVTPGGTTQTVIIDSNGELGSAATAASVAYGVVQRSRTTDFTTDGNWRNIPHDTDLITNTDLLSTAGTTLIDVNQDGLVEITFQCTCEPPDDDATTFEARFRKSNAVQPAGNIIHNMYQGSDNDKSDWSLIYRSIILDLNDGDWLGVQVRDSGGGPIILQADSIIFTAKYLGSS